MKYLEDGVLLNFKEYANYTKALKALAALRDQTNFKEEVEA